MKYFGWQSRTFSDRRGIFIERIYLYLFDNPKICERGEYISVAPRDNQYICWKFENRFGKMAQILNGEEKGKLVGIGIRQDRLYNLEANSFNLSRVSHEIELLPMELKKIITTSFQDTKV